MKLYNYQLLKPTVTKGFLAFVSIASIAVLAQKANASTAPISMKPFHAIEHALQLQDSLETKISLTLPSSDSSKTSNKSSESDGATHTSISVSTGASAGGLNSEPIIEINGKDIVPDSDAQQSPSVKLPADTNIRIRYRQSDETEKNSRFNLRINGSDIAN